MVPDPLSDRALNRATLARQLLLERSSMRPVDAITHLVGLQAQNPLDPYLALWSRLARFDPTSVGDRLEDRTLVRSVVIRGTIHLVTADDACFLRPLMQPVLDAEIARHGEFAADLVDVDMAPVLAFAHSLLAKQPMSPRTLRDALAAEFPSANAAALAYACRCLLPLVQVPPRGVWGKVLQVTSTPLDTWVGRSLDRNPSIDTLVLRYLAAFGPASVADVATWTRLGNLAPVIERLRPRLRPFRDERGRELLDLPDAPRPDPATPAPVRVLPEFDNVLLSHADRSRFGSDGNRRFASATGPVRGTVLVDGLVAAVWHSEVDRKAERAVIVVEHAPLGSRARTAMEREAGRAGAFWHGGASEVDVRLVALT